MCNTTSTTTSTACPTAKEKECKKSEDSKSYFVPLLISIGVNVLFVLGIIGGGAATAAGRARRDDDFRD